MSIKIDASVPWSSLVDEAKKVIVSWFAVITRGHRAFVGLDLNSDATLLFSLRFMVYMCIVCFALQFPLLAVFGAKLENIVFVLTSLLFGLVEWLCYVAIFHLSIRVFGGKGLFKASVAAFCFLTAFEPIGMAVFLVPKWYQLKTIDKVPYIIGPNDSLFRYLSSEEKAQYLVFLALGLALLVYFFIQYYKSLRVIHRVGNLKTLVSFTFSVALIILFDFYVGRPLDEVLKRLVFK